MGIFRSKRRVQRIPKKLGPHSHGQKRQFPSDKWSLGSDEGLLQMRQPNLTQYSPKNSVQNPCCVPGSSPANPMKIPNVAVPTLSNMTCNPKARHLNQVFALFDKCSYLPPAIPVLVPTCSHCFPEIFPDHSWILPRSFPHLFQSCPLSHGFPRSFLDLTICQALKQIFANAVAC